MVCCVYPFGVQAKLSVNSIIPMREKKAEEKAEKAEWAEKVWIHDASMC